MKTFISFLTLLIIVGQAFGQSTTISPDNIAVPKTSNLANIANPQAGMVVYNTTDKALYFRNDVMWVNLNSATTATNSGTLYYKMTGVTPEIYTGTHGGQSPAFGLDLPSISNNGTNSNTILTFMKNLDLGSIKMRNIFYVVSPAVRSNVAEFLLYDSSDVLYFSYKITGFRIISMTANAPACENCVRVSETIGLTGLSIGFRDWKNNLGGTFDFSTGWSNSY